LAPNTFGASRFFEIGLVHVAALLKNVGAIDLQFGRCRSLLVLLATARPSR
jgi:hypothetical protein